MPLISRRHALALMAGASLVPARASAHVAPPRNEIRAGLAQRFTDMG
ncbi:MAG: class D beta-lactamase, partial [Bradyrhizobium sp.]|nr:class D beta-lactamase [Bradyrhizobium sp.]